MTRCAMVNEPGRPECAGDPCTYGETFLGSPDNLLSGWRSAAEPQEAAGRVRIDLGCFLCVRAFALPHPDNKLSGLPEGRSTAATGFYRMLSERNATSNGRTRNSDGRL
jgi:hypothetical protein